LSEESLQVKQNEAIEQLHGPKQCASMGLARSTIDVGSFANGDGDGHNAQLAGLRW
jgi:hypothetical protein